MDYRLEELIDIPILQSLLDKQNKIFSFPSAIIDNEGKILISVGWQDIFPNFHKLNLGCEKGCIKSDQNISEKFQQQFTAKSFRCPHGLIDNAIPIVIGGKHLGSYFTGCFLEKPDMGYFRKLAKNYGLDEKIYFEAIEKVPVLTKDKLDQYIDFIKVFIEIIVGIGLKGLKDIETNKLLRENEEKYRLLADHMTDMEWLMDLNLKTIYISPSIEKQRGFTLEELMQLPLDQNLTPDSYKLAMNVFSEELPKIMSDPTYSYSQTLDLEFYNKNGTTFWLQIMFDIIRDKNGNPTSILGVGRDITNPKMTENALRLSESSLADSQEIAKMGNWEFDILTNKILWSKSFYRIFGFEPYEVEPTYEMFMNMVYPDDMHLIAEADKYIIDTKRPISQELRFVLRDGSLRWMLNKLVPVFKEDVLVKLKGVCMDITEQKFSEEKLLESEERYKQLVELSPDSIIVHCRGKIVFANLAAIKMMDAKSLNELKGKSAIDFVHPDFKDVAAKRVRRIYIDEVKAEFDFEKLIKLNGEIIDVETTAIPINYSGEKAGLVIIRDITERKRAEDELRESKQIIEGIINAIHARVFWKDRNLIYLGCNKEFSRDAGYSDPEEIIGKDDYQMGWHDQAELYRKDDLQVIESGCPKINIEEPQTTPDGKTITLLTSKIPLVDLNGKISGVIGTYIDISDRKQAEDKILNQLEELQRWQEITLGREDRNIQLKNEVNELLIRLGETIRYPSLEVSVNQALAAVNG